MALDAVVMPLAIGVGCRKGCAATAIANLVDRASRGFDRGGARLFTLDRKAGDADLLEAARLLGLPLVFLPAAALHATEPRVETRSARVHAAVGVSSVAEAAALAGAGPGARLLVPRLSDAGATCAVAIPAGREP